MVVYPLYKYLQISSLELRNSNLANERKSGEEEGGRRRALAVRGIGCPRPAMHWCMASRVIGEDWRLRSAE